MNAHSNCKNGLAAIGPVSVISRSNKSVANRTPPMYCSGCVQRHHASSVRLPETKLRQGDVEVHQNRPGPGRASGANARRADPRGNVVASLPHRLVVFFFQAEDGIRDSSVTGVQTCALPI